MRVINDFVCSECKKVFEAFLEASETSTRCTCGEEATKQISGGRFMLDGTDPGFPDAYNKWTTTHEKAGRNS